MPKPAESRMGKGMKKYFFPNSQTHGDLETAPAMEKDDFSRRRSSSEYEDAHCPFSDSSSSRETSGSFEPMLGRSISKRKKRRKYDRKSSRVIRYLCWTLISTVLILILSLVRASHLSSRRLETGAVEKQAPKPPAWESFEGLKRYFGGVRSLIPREKNPPEYPSGSDLTDSPTRNETVSDKSQSTLPKSIPFDPYPDYNSKLYLDKHEAKHECFLDLENSIQIPQVRYYKGIPYGLPNAVMGSYAVLGLRDDICFERFGRLGAYGYGYSIKRGGSGAGLEGDREGAEDMWAEDKNMTKIDYSEIRWTHLQQACEAKNKGRFDPHIIKHENLFQNARTSGKAPSQKETNSIRPKRDAEMEQRLGGLKNSTASQGSKSGGKSYLQRTVILIRTWWNYEYREEDVIYLRSLISELALLSGGEYTVHFLIHVKDDNVPIWADEHIYNRILENSLPKEFHGMGTLWSERQMSLIYGGLQESFFRDLPVHGVYRGSYMPVQYFAQQHPEYHFVWNWEMDVRYTGQWYHLLERVRTWTKTQPRKGLWERNGRFYIPSIHGTWEDFRQMVRVQTEMGTDSPNNMWSGLKPSSGSVPGSLAAQGRTDTPVWGPLSPPDVLKGQEDLLPPTSLEKDNYVWGVGEEADLITFNPIYDPDGTTWFFTEDVTGYNTTDGLPPRRAAITTTTRLSQRLLQLMHRETMLARHHMFSEMWPASCALHHGLKAVYAPHPVYIDRNWPTSYLTSVMNGGRNGASGGARTSVFGSREHNFKGTTWFYDAEFSPKLWRRWLGYKVDNDGGEQAELAGEGRMCLPGVLLHPIKAVSMVIQGARQAPEQVQEGAEEELPGREEAQAVKF